MVRISRTGWIVRTALRIGREFFEHFNDGTLRSERRSEIEMRALIEARLNSFERSVPAPKDQAQGDEVLWTFMERGASGTFVGSSVSFLAPDIYTIRRTRKQDAERARIARQAMKERAEIKRVMKAGRRTANSRGTGKEGAPVNTDFQNDERQVGDRHREKSDAPLQMPTPTPEAPRRSGGIRL